jgi:imidazolonepropionase-like amidohydrolase
MHLLHVCRSGLAACLVLLGTMLSLRASDPPQPAPTELVLLPSVVHPLTGPPRTNVAVLIREGRIAAVGAPIPPSAPVIRMEGLQLFPGLIAVNTVLGLQEIDSVRATRDTTEVGEFTPDVFAWIAINPDSELIPVARANGFTHVEAIPLGRSVTGHSALLQLNGWTIEDLAVRRALALHVFWPAFTLETTPKHLLTQPDRWKSVEDQIKERDRRLKELDDFFEDAEAYSRARSAAGVVQEVPVVPAAGSLKSSTWPIPGVKGFTPVPLWESMLLALRRQVPIFIHADETRQIRSAVEWAVRRNYRFALIGGRDAWRLTDFLAKHQVPVAFEHVFTQPARDTDPYDAHFAAAGILQRAGIPVSFTEGTDRFGASNLRNIPYAAAQAMAYGLPRLEAHRGLSYYPASLLGLSDQLGSIQPGRDATFIAVDGDILDARANVRRLWIRGNEVSLESKHTRLYERYRQRPRATP